MTNGMPNANCSQKPKPAPKPEKKEEKKEAVLLKNRMTNKSKQLKKLNQELAKMEEQIETLEKTVKELETQLADDKLYTRFSKSTAGNGRLTSLKKLELKEVQAKVGKPG